MASDGASGDQAQTALDRLNHDIDDLVDLKIQSGEADWCIRLGSAPG